MVKFTKSDYFNLRNLAWTFLLDNNISALPLNLKKIAIQNSWFLMPYTDPYTQQFLKKYDTLNYHKKYSGFTKFILNKFFIFYDDNILTEIQRFTIAHEFGHIMLLHLQNKLGNIEYEKQANMFAIRILAPACVIKELNINNSHDISYLCSISEISAEYRFKRLQLLEKRNKFYTNDLEIKVLKNFKNYIKKYKG